MDITSLLRKDIATLSTGEMRKVFLVKALLQNPKIVILDEPFDGLDSRSKNSFMKILNSVMKRSQLILITHNQSEIPPGITHVLVVENGQIIQAGKKEDMVKFLPKEVVMSQDMKQKKSKRVGTESLIALHDVVVFHGNERILDHVSWEMKVGENWAIVGHNGAGKSALLQLITGDNQQAYANAVYLFGRKKDSGIPLDEIQQKIGVVSSELMLRYNQKTNVYNVILSGFFESIGLYKKATATQKKRTTMLVKKFGMQEIVKKEYQQLSFGQKRLVLISRAVVKSPQILILDEPCHGLDGQNRKKILDMIEVIGNKTKTNLLLVTHNKQELVPSISKVLELENGRVKKMYNRYN